MPSLNVKEKIHEWIIRIMDDPLVKTLLISSHLTKIQLETILIDVLSEQVAEKDLGYEEKARMRLSKPNISRGAFNRTLRQARRNVVCSIYTILLLGYLGILETPNLNSYLDISNRLESYMQAYRALWKESRSGTDDEEKVRTILMIREDLKSTLEGLSRLKALPDDV